MGGHMGMFCFLKRVSAGMCPFDRAVVMRPWKQLNHVKIFKKDVLLFFSTTTLTILSLSKYAHQQSLSQTEHLHEYTRSERVVHYQINKPIDDDLFREYMKGIELAHPDRTIFVLFMGSKGEACGQHWCPDCQVAEPIIEREVARYNSNTNNPGIVLITCTVCRKFMHTNAPYRVNPSLRLTCVPCLIKWNFGVSASTPSALRLSDHECRQPLWVRQFLSS